MACGLVYQVQELHITFRAAAVTMAKPSLAAADRTRASDPVTVYEGDIVLLYCSDANGYLYSDPPW